jgi:hypothetical protein
MKNFWKAMKQLFCLHEWDIVEKVYTTKVNGKSFMHVETYEICRKCKKKRFRYNSINK